eukprot:scaffold155926_cov33-Prasinocladus_malaysianus.AAC.1
MSVPRVRRSSRGSQPSNQASDMEEERAVVHLPRVDDHTAQNRQWNVPPETAAGTPGRALRERNGDRTEVMNAPNSSALNQDCHQRCILPEGYQ